MTATTTTSTSTPSATIKTCSDCKAALGRSFWKFWDKNEYSCDNKDKGGCNAVLCTSCYLLRPLYYLPSEEEEEKENNTKEGANNMNNNNMTDRERLFQAKMHLLCKSCFQSKSVLDFDKKYDTIHGTSDIVLVWLHGGSACRALFHPYAVEMNKRFGHSSILLDLPGHGSRVDEPLSLESCLSTVQDVLIECGYLKKTTKQEVEVSNNDKDDKNGGISPTVTTSTTTTTSNSNKKLVYVGGSLGAYVGFYILSKMPNVFSSAVLMDCGQNVGPGASYHAKLGLVMLGFVSRNFANAALLPMMLDVSKKSPADYQLLESCYGAGMFFQQADRQIECLRAVAPADLLADLHRSRRNRRLPILYMNGSLDYRDSENKWLECSNKTDNDGNDDTNHNVALSELVVFEGGDHFFTHDTRFLDTILTRMNQFVCQHAG